MRRVRRVPYQRVSGGAWNQPALWYHELTGLTQVQFGTLVTVQAVNPFPPPAGGWWYFWYVDGVLAARTAENEWSFYLDPGEQAELSCRAAASPDYGDVAAAPDAYPPRRTLEWTRAEADDIAHYRVQQATGASAPGSGDWSTIATVMSNGRWLYRLLTPRLTDLTWYWWRIQAVDDAGNVGTATTIGPVYVVRRPEQVTTAIEFDNGTQRVTIDAA